jgi:hypothetical protein
LGSLALSTKFGCGNQKQRSFWKSIFDSKERQMKIPIGILLIVVAIAAFAYQGIEYTTKEKVVEFGPLQMTAERTRTLPLPPIVGAIAFVGGIVLLVTGGKKA